MTTLKLGVIAFKVKDVTQMREALDSHVYEYAHIFGKLSVVKVDGELIVSFVYRRKKPKGELDELTA